MLMPVPLPAAMLDPLLSGWFPSTTVLCVLTRVDVVIQQWVSSYGEAGEAVMRLILAAMLGGLIGMEREIRGHQAGLRTFMLVAAGSALAMVVSVAFADWDKALPTGGAANIQIDPARIAYGVMTGVGFLGAGTILRRGSRVTGLTTAAGIWSVAALGLAAGYGLYAVSIVATLLMLMTLVALSYVQPLLPVMKTRRIRVRVPIEAASPQEFRRFLRDHGMRTRRMVLRKGRRQTIILEAQVEFYDSSRMRALLQDLMPHPQWTVIEIQL